MKWPVVSAAVVFLLATFWFCHGYMSLAKRPAGESSTVQTVVAPPGLPAIEESKVGPLLQHRVAEAADVAVVTNDRRRIFDSPDIMTTVETVRKNGTPDERDWARSLLSICTGLFVELPKHSLEIEASRPPDPASAPDGLELAEKKNDASEALRQRCRGVKKLTSEERAAIRQDLNISTDVKTPLRQINQLTDSDDNRWTPDQFQLVTQSLYGGDPIVGRMAFFALLHVNDFNAPGGEDRQMALIAVLGEKYASADLSEFEALGRCRSLGQCSGQPLPPPPVRTASPAVLALEARYKAALVNRLDARAILAIR